MNQAGLISFWFNKVILFNNYSTLLYILQKKKQTNKKTKTRESATKKQLVYTNLLWTT